MRGGYVWIARFLEMQLRLGGVSIVTSNFHFVASAKSQNLESAKADEYGRKIHEECYALKMKLKQATTPPAA